MSLKQFVFEMLISKRNQTIFIHLSLKLPNSKLILVENQSDNIEATKKM